MRWILAFIALTSLTLIGLSYLGEAGILNVMGQAHELAAKAGGWESQAARDGFQRSLMLSFHFWAYMRYGCIGILVLTIIGFRRTGGGK